MKLKEVRNKMRDLRDKSDQEYYKKVFKYSILDALKALIKFNKNDFKHEMGIAKDACEMIKLAK